MWRAKLWFWFAVFHVKMSNCRVSLLRRCFLATYHHLLCLALKFPKIIVIRVPSSIKEFNVNSRLVKKISNHPTSLAKWPVKWWEVINLTGILQRFSGSDSLWWAQTPPRLVLDGCSALTGLWPGILRFSSFMLVSGVSDWRVALNLRISLWAVGHDTFMEL